MFRTVSEMIQSQRVIPDKTVSLFVSNIWVYTQLDHGQPTVLPFFADGYPGLVGYRAKQGMRVNPQGKLMPPVFLYGQTLKPVELLFDGPFSMVVFQFYPFILKSFFGIDPGSVNDDCIDLSILDDPAVKAVLRHLRAAQSTEAWIAAISNFLYTIFLRKRRLLDLTLKQAVQRVIEAGGQLPIKDLSRLIGVSERTLERRFIDETGLRPKQFARIIQFQSSLQQLSDRDYQGLTEVVYRNGYADQSHFIRVFRAFTGRTPKAFLRSGY